MFAREYTTITRRVGVLTIKLLVYLAIICELDICLLPSGFPIKTIHNFVHGLIECIKQTHRNLLVDKRYSVKFPLFVHIQTSLVVNILICFHTL